MKLLPDAQQGPTITGYDRNWIAVNGTRYDSNLLVDSSAGASLWQCGGFDTLGADDFDRMAELQPELVIFGSGERIQFPRPQWLQTLYARRIGVETMDTQAACRTYNFLAGEGRRVLAALLLPA